METHKKKERIICDTIEVLPPPKNEPVSECECESDSEDAESSGSDEPSHGDGDGDGDSDGGESDDEISRVPTIESESFVSAPSSPKDPEPNEARQKTEARAL